MCYKRDKLTLKIKIWLEGIGRRNKLNKRNENNGNKLVTKLKEFGFWQHYYDYWQQNVNRHTILSHHQHHLPHHSAKHFKCYTRGELS